MITIYTVAYNEELQIKFFIDHYRSRFENCDIVIYDNISKDNTAKIAIQNNCTVIPYDTNNQIQDRRYLEIKNNCWKQAKTNWVLVCDVDELLDISKQDLLYEESIGSTVIQSCGFNMINMEDNYDLDNIKYGVRHEFSDKKYLFNKSLVKEINYSPGCHDCNPVGTIVYSKNIYNVYHYNFININESIRKYEEYGKRLSPENLKNGWGFHYLRPKEEIVKEFLFLRENAIKILN
jgi:hypothetical protein